jgi:hypothetical protein
VFEAFADWLLQRLDQSPRVAVQGMGWHLGRKGGYGGDALVVLCRLGVQFGQQRVAAQGVADVVCAR